MAYLVTSGAGLKCTLGSSPSTLTVMPTNKVQVDTPAANIVDQTSMLNIASFGLCRSPANPTVATATAAAMGVLTPMPCVPMTVAPWATGTPTVLIGNMAALNDESKLMCSWGGTISITSAGQVKVTV